MTQKAHAEGMRALVLFTASVQDEVALRRAAGEDATDAARLNDLLLPIVKGYGSERSYALLGTESLQVLGGSGYLQDHPLEQYVRDAKIDTLYEGTTAIQGQDLFFRKIVKDRGQALAALSERILETVKGDVGNGRLARDRELLGRALEDVQAIVATMAASLQASQQEPRRIYEVGLGTTRLLLAAGDVVVAWLLLRGAEVAVARLDAGAEGRDRDFYEGKVAAAQFFARNVLPLVRAQRVVAQNADASLMDLPESAF
jgi:hypothetical protein